MNKSVLHWSYRDFQKIPEDLLNYDEFLQEVYLKENFITIIPQWLFQLTNLRFIHLSGNSILELPEEIYYLENLEFLDVSNNKLKKLPNNFGKLKNLQRFNASGNEIVFLSKNIGHLNKLEILDLSGNFLRYLPVEIGDCLQIYEIILNDNSFLQNLPNSLTRLPKLETLCADRCGLLYLPPILVESVTNVRLFNNTFVTHIPIVYKKHIRRFYEVIHPTCDSIPPENLRITIRETETGRKLFLPFYTRKIYHNESRRVFTLYEHCLKALNEFNMSASILAGIPQPLADSLQNSPIATCSNEICQQHLYTEYYFMVAKRLNSSSSLIFSCNFCSLDCSTDWLKRNENDYYSVKYEIL